LSVFERVFAPQMIIQAILNGDFELYRECLGDLDFKTWLCNCRRQKKAIDGVEGEYYLQSCASGVKPEAESTQFGCC